MVLHLRGFNAEISWKNNENTTTWISYTFCDRFSMRSYIFLKKLRNRPVRLYLALKSTRIIAALWEQSCQPRYRSNRYSLHTSHVFDQSFLMAHNCIPCVLCNSLSVVSFALIFYRHAAESGMWKKTIFLEITTKFLGTCGTGWGGEERQAQFKLTSAKT